MHLGLVYLVAIIEGFSTLAVEIIAIRAATPVVGSSIILTSVFLGIILLALSAGYYVGGSIASKYPKKKLITLLATYLVFAGVRYLFVTFWWEVSFLEYLLEVIPSYVMVLFVAAVALFFLPVFIASQTLPILTEIIPEKSKGKAAGSILFASTVGSFFGSVLTSIVLFELRGVAMTGTIVGSMLLVAAGIVLISKHKKLSLFCFAGAVLVFLLSSSIVRAIDENISYSFDSAYQHIAVRQLELNQRPVAIYHTNGAYSSGIFKDTKQSPFKYIREAVRLTEQLKPRKVLVIGAAGFVYPYEIAQLPYVDRIDTIDIDPEVKRIAEEEFLEEQLPEKINFIPQSARYVVNQAIKQGEVYDLILVDAYNGKSVPDELTTAEFVADLNAIVKDERVVYNIIMDENLDSAFARSMTATLQSIHGDVYVNNVTNNNNQVIENFIVGFEAYSDDYLPHASPGTVYTDDKRSTERDLVEMFWKL